VEVLRQAFAIARSGKPGPVLVDLPRDLLDNQVPAPEYIPVGPPPRLSAPESDITAAAAALVAAESPILIAGGGTIASGASAQVRALAAGEQRPMHPLRPIRAVREQFPRETTAARLVYPDRPAVGFVGDGSFQMVMNILAVAAEYRLGVTWCVLNDGALARFATSSNTLGRPDPGHRVRGPAGLRHDRERCGCFGERVEDPLEVDAAVTRALEANERGIPAVLDVAVARERVLGTLEHYAFYPERLRSGDPSAAGQAG
jgi:thiamine pyrophosphate-dependent acetolactate synthase large subunit-like protein